MTDKLALGTVQFGGRYGINNSTGVPQDEEISDIFDEAYDNGIRTLDTAAGYGEAEKKIGLLATQDFDIITKLAAADSKESFRVLLQNSLVRLKRPSVYGLMAHNADNLIAKPFLWDCLQEAKAAGLIKKAGYSLYQPEQLDKALDLKMIPDLVQVPYSIFDRKFENYFQALKNMNCEIHVRSVFLQGLYFMSPGLLPAKLQPLAPALEKLNTICEEEKLSVGKLALNFSLLNSTIDRVVIGVDKLEQLKANIADVCDPARVAGAVAKATMIRIEMQQLLNPAHW